MKLEYLLEGPEECVTLVADHPRRRWMIHPIVVLVDHMIHIVDEFLLRFDKFANHSSAQWVLISTDRI